MAAHNDFGRTAEQLAAAFLARRGWHVVSRNWRWRRVEIDLIMRRGRTVAFVEVRARRSTSHGHPLETIDGRKRRRLESAAAAWITSHGRPGDEFRFDAVSVLAPGADATHARLHHIEDAWRL